MLVVSLGLGIFSDALLRVTPWGLNLFVVTLGVLLASRLLAGWGAVELRGEGRWLVAPMAFFGFGLVWRDSPTLDVANWLGLLVSASLAALTARAGQLRLAGVTQYVLGVAYVAQFALGGLLPAVRWDVRPRELGRGWWLRPSLAAGRGVLLAIPPLVVFGSLFTAADTNFERLVDETFGSLDLRDGLLHVGLTLAYAWLLGGTLREMLLAPLRPREWLNGPRGGPRAGAIEVVVVLMLLNLLFATFVVLQLPYLFGGMSEVARLGYSEYARRGFFELVWVTGLAVPVLLLTHWLVRDASPRGERLVRLLALVLVGLLYVVMASAAERLWLYVDSFGLTELRVQAAALMVWLAIVLAWFVATVVRQRRHHFGFGALVSALVVLAALDVINPDALIVRTNAHRQHLVESNAPFDERPLASFSPDATPAIVEALPLLTAEAREQVEARLHQRAPRLASTVQDWRSFNLSRAQAVQALAQDGNG